MDELGIFFKFADFSPYLIHLCSFLSNQFAYFDGIIAAYNNATNMQPKIEHITIKDNEVHIKNFIQEIIVQPRATMRKWAGITRQTPAMKLGYIGQHLVSLVTGVPGTSSGARGDDLSDGSEVKSCNKIDQVDKCRNCGARVMRHETQCPACKSNDIDRRDDSKWLFLVRSNEELEQYKNMDRVVLLLMDYPKFNESDFQDIRISIFELYPKEAQCSVFVKLLDNYYQNIYMSKMDDRAKPNPMNFHPFGFQFYKSNPVKIFECTIKNVDSVQPNISIDTYIQPDIDRSLLTPLLMPSAILNRKEWQILCKNPNFMQKYGLNEHFEDQEEKKKIEIVPFLDQQDRDLLPLRDIVSIRQTTTYHRSSVLRSHR